MTTATQAPLRVAITGASGFIGQEVRRRLEQEGHETTRVVRSRDAASAADAFYWKPADGAIDREGLAGHDVVINLAGELVAGIWTRAKKRRIRDSRVDGTRLLAETMAGLEESRRPRLLINASAVGYYGHRVRHAPVTESDPPGSSFMAGVVREWEAATEPARAAGVRVVMTRFAPVLDPDGLLLQMLTTATRLGVGAKIGDGTQPFPWVTRAEIGQVMVYLIRHTEIDGPVNVAAPERTTNRQLVDTLARVLGRPRFLALPAPAVRLLGEQGRELLGGVWMVPGKLQDAGYLWRDPHLEPALRSMLDRPKGGA